MSNKYKTELKTAIEASQKAGVMQTNSINSIKKIDIKKDSSPVTEIDRKCEEIIKHILTSSFPNDSFLGEESGLKKGTSDRTWIVDPLDGTRPYIHNIPTYSVLIALMDKDEPVVGVVYLPALNEIYYASKGDGAYCGDDPIKVSQCSDIKESMASCLGTIEKIDSKEGKIAIDLLKRCDYNYGFMDAYTYMAVASGKLDFAIGLIDNSWDRAAAACIVKEAGGHYSDLNGKKTISNTTFLVTNHNIHKTITGFTQSYSQ